ncbi:hypothetical protein PILCRDRAFT_820189 [Piloderma croceum F 1598]|uniref:N-acetyltransferase domain-containing protein n=1 Tax=Piloderma croceum (strain F 1598) TaxID=765440 RepID=A0A0C3FT36_PILCF|nr:hypothetical protein PILCRDRAFT_820189 [Piloderma croceum F 1598]
MFSLIFTLTRGSDVTQEQLKACADLFSKNYGARVKMSVAKLQLQCLGSPADSMLVTCHENDVLVGHVFCRQRGIATVMLGRLKQDHHTAFGLASSHPAACLALCKSARVSIQRIDLAFMKSNAIKVLGPTPVEYLKSPYLRGTLFEDQPIDPTAISSIFTEFYVDHQEPLEVLKKYESTWPLGALLDGHEFFVLVKLEASP